MYSKIKRSLREAALSTGIGYSLYLKKKGWGRSAYDQRQFPGPNTTLKSSDEWQKCCIEVEKLRLPSHPSPQKNWDSLISLGEIINHVSSPKAKILDAGATMDSVILPWLYIYGYRNLTGLNLSFNRTIFRGSICYEHGDMTNTRFKDNFFDAVSCLSVVEHGVNLTMFFREMNRIIKPGGILVLSTDYWPSPIETGHIRAFDTDFKVFNKKTLEEMFKIAATNGFSLHGETDTNCKDKAVAWDEHNIEYTFFCCTLIKEIS
ncbi:type 11 methyltransferase [Chitinispirillum alkaliphilum]|nr:type 11 methyltransferase [Chitinispirillum alkaliphilum]